MTDTTTNTLPNSVPTGIPDVGTAGTAPMDAVTLAMQQTPGQVDQLADQCKQALVNTYMQLYGAAWKMGTGLTPKQFFASYGVKSLAFLIRGAALKAFILSQYPDLTLPGVPNNYAVTPVLDSNNNPTGAVTISEND